MNLLVLQPAAWNAWWIEYPIEITIQRLNLNTDQLTVQCSWSQLTSCQFTQSVSRCIWKVAACLPSRKEGWKKGGWMSPSDRSLQVAHQNSNSVQIILTRRLVIGTELSYVVEIGFDRQGSIWRRLHGVGLEHFIIGLNKTRQATGGKTTGIRKWPRIKVRARLP